MISNFSLALLMITLYFGIAYRLDKRHPVTGLLWIGFSILTTFSVLFPLL